jgi:antitoxin MazE
MEVELVSVPSSLEALLATIPSDFTYPDDVVDFVASDSQGQEIL